MDYNVFLKNNMNVINAFAKKYHNIHNYDDFRQELMIEVWHHMENYDPSKNDNAKAYLLWHIDILAKRVLYKMNADKAGRFNDSFETLISDIMGEQNEGHRLEIDFALYDFTEIEKKIIYCIDFNLNIKPDDIANKLGISRRMVYYHLKNIRKKLKKE